eukprot:scaffold2196_cov259-Chaetoceros_neogracile.AAC.9
MKLTIALSATLLTISTAKRFVFTIDDDCNYDALSVTAARDYEITPERLISLLGETVEVDAREVVDVLCEKARANNSSPKMGAYDFGDINGKGWQFDNNYFDGGTYINEEYEAVATEDTFEEIYNDIAKNTLITFPNDNTSDGGCMDKDPADNTDVCYVDLASGAASSHVAGGFAIFPNDTEGASHCHGMAWSGDLTATDTRYRGNSLFYISMYDHLSQRGYVREVPGSPMCGCINQMPVVSRADCTEMDVKETYQITLNDNADKRMRAKITDTTITFNACRDAEGNAGGNDLEDYLKYLQIDDATINKYLVGPNDNEEQSNCPAAIRDFLVAKEITTQ